MHRNSRKNKKDISTIIFASVTFAIIFSFQVILNLRLRVPHSDPDECGAMMLAAKLGGSDWSRIFEKNGLYYGFGTTLPFFFLFRLIKDPIILYRSMLAVGCFWRTLPVFVIFPIAKRYFRIENNILISVMAIAAILGTPTRGSAIDNEPMLILMGWLSSYIILRLFDSKSIKERVICLILLLMTLGYSITAHQRAVICVVAAVITIAVRFIANRKPSKKAIIITAASFTAVAGGMIALLFVLSSVIASREEAVMNNTLSAVIVGIPQKLEALFSGEGFVNFISLAASNFWGVSVYFCGMVGVLILTVFSAGDERNDALSRMSLYPVLVFLISLIGLGILWNSEPQPTITEGEELSRGYFYLRYIGNTFGICLFLSMGNMIKRGFSKVHLTISLLLVLITFRFTYIVSLKKAFFNENYEGDFFGFLGPLSFSGSDVYMNGKGILYYVIPTVISVGILVIIFFLARYHKNVAIALILAAVMIYQYSYLLFMKDADTADLYYSYADSLYKIKTEYPECFEDSDVYYCSSQTGLDVNSQVILNDVSLIPGFPTEAGENMILLTNNEAFFKENISIDLSGFDLYYLDDNEIIYTNKADLKKALEKYLWER